MGPILYMLHGAAYLISKDTFFGVYLIEILACFAFLCICYHTARLFTERYAVHSVCITALFTYSAVSFYSGDSAEELCLPLLAYAFYIGLKSLKSEKTAHITEMEYLCVGITSASVLWIKYTMLGFYIGWFLIPAFLYIKNGNWKMLVKSVLYICAGIVIVSLPVLMYFIMNDAVDSLIQVYFYDNMFKYAPVLSGGLKLAAITDGYFRGFHCLRWRSSFAASMIITGMLCLANSKFRYCAGQFIASFVCLFATVFWGGNAYAYYALIFNVFSICGISMLVEFVADFNRLRVNNWVKAGMVIIGEVIWIFIVSTNTYMLKYRQMDLPQYKFAQTIMQNKNPTLLNYGCMDMGEYTVCNILPVNRFFAKYNIHLKEMEDAHLEIIENGKVDFLVTREMYNFETYECIDEASYINEGFEYTYYLYKRKNLNG